MTYNFDEIVERRNTDCSKYEVPKRETGREDIIPMWVADMDFRTPPFVIRAIEQRLAQGILGYTGEPKAYVEHIAWWLDRRFGMNVEAKHLQYFPGVVPAIAHAVEALTTVGEGVLIMEPVYHPFRMVIEGTGRTCVATPLVYANDVLSIDFDNFEQCAKRAKLLILCHPHNPIGREWTREELERIADICHRHNIIVISDEIHADMMLFGHKHLPFAMVNEVARDISITFMAPSKVFNMPGVISSYGVAFNSDLRERMKKRLESGHYTGANIFAYDVTVACYTEEGDEWRRQMLAYVESNITYVEQYLAEHCPKIRAHRPDASFLIWLNCTNLGLGCDTKLKSFFIDEAGLYLNPGCMFGTGGAGFMRLNIAAPRATVETAMKRLKAAYDKFGF